ncbi:DUF1918 domain-containing protein [Actinocorallia sp. API 0066]|uniref:DUF1918 domain-containing protein n=1 Tax=Actinocorallia sp. API 0066 TaxID=2896846 RepID=UPI001E382C38|nr:DUF1918 domain-containing protein [Actinocorallia sp. API 0066]MCD0449769.1 DUF1918 domain-containing protein [Actinocorallia sp. API 0066]
MKAAVGDRLVLLGPDDHTHDRDGEIVEIPDPGGAPPYYVRWEDTGRRTLIYPGPDARVLARH